MNGAVVAVCVVHEVKRDPGPAGKTAIDKRQVPGPVRAHPLGLDGDLQCDVERHGGPDQAVYAYAEEEAQRWAGELGRPLPPGIFGENLRLSGLPVTDAVIGEHWQIGAELRVEVTAPRIPCATFARHVGEPRWVRRFADRADVGTYLRVLRPGPVREGDPVRVVSTPGHDVTVREMFRALMNGPADLDRLSPLLAEDTLAGTLRTGIEDLLARA